MSVTLPAGAPVGSEFTGDATVSSPALVALGVNGCRVDMAEAGPGVSGMPVIEPPLACGCGSEEKATSVTSSLPVLPGLAWFRWPHAASNNTTHRQAGMRGRVSCVMAMPIRFNSMGGHNAVAEVNACSKQFRACRVTTSRSMGKRRTRLDMGIHQMLGTHQPVFKAQQKKGRIMPALFANGRTVTQVAARSGRGVLELLERAHFHLH